jgi:hypothetical protein
VVPTNSL